MSHDLVSTADKQFHTCTCGKWSIDLSKLATIPQHVDKHIQDAHAAHVRAETSDTATSAYRWQCFADWYLGFYGREANRSSGTVRDMYDAYEAGRETEYEMMRES